VSVFHCEKLFNSLMYPSWPVIKSETVFVPTPQYQWRLVWSLIGRPKSSSSSVLFYVFAHCINIYRVGSTIFVYVGRRVIGSVQRSDMIAWAVEPPTWRAGDGKPCLRSQHSRQHLDWRAKSQWVATSSQLFESRWYNEVYRDWKAVYLQRCFGCMFWPAVSG
jgi:hypothetical protein